MRVRAKNWWGSGCVTALLTLWVSGATAADDVEDRLQRLERNVELILKILEDKGISNSKLDIHPADPVASDSREIESRASMRVSPALTTRDVTVAYYLSTMSLSTAKPPHGDPSSKGAISFNDIVSFDPAHYDLPSGIFSEYRDPATYSDVGVQLTGGLRIDEDGPFEFVFYPKPARAGASAVGTTMAIRLNVDDRSLLESEPSGSWKPVRVKVALKKGLHMFDLWAVTKSPGYGPSPTASRLVVSLKGPRDASPRPLPLVSIER